MTHICWESDHVKRFIGSAVAEAIDQQSAEEFFSRHVEMTLNGATAEGAVVREREYSEDEFLNEFLEAGAGRSSVLGAIIGESGHGKTHYLLWVEQKLRQKSDAHRRVVRIPRIKTSLPGIIKALIESVPESARGEFQDIESKLTQYSNESVSDAILRLELKNAMTVRLCREENAEHFEIAAEFGRAGPIAANYVKEERMLRLLSIHAIQEWLIAEGGVIGRLVRSSIRPEGADAPLDEMIQFVGSDIPASQWSEALSDNEVEASLWRPFRNRPDEFAKLLNWGLGHAVRDFMAQRFSVHNPEETIVQIRKAIHRADPEASIVLLMEDLANARYAEADLLNACTWEEDGLVPMRTLFATTTGLFKDLRLSVRQRITPSSNPLPLLAFAGESWKSNGKPELAFAAKYLPVFRRAPDGETQCGQCNEKVSCDAFGEHAGIGLYPFSGRVLAHVAKKVVDEKGAFHPRTFLRMVVNELVSAANHIRDGSFPGVSLDVAPREAHPDVAALQQRMMEANATPEEVSRATRIANAYGQLRQNGRQDVAPLVWERFKVAIPEAGEAPRLPLGDVEKEKELLGACKSIVDIDNWRKRLLAFEWSDQDWRELRQAEESRRGQVGGQSPPPPPQQDGVQAWVAGKELLPTDDERLKSAVTNQLLESIDWAVLGVGPAFRETLVKGHSNIVVAGSKIQDGDGAGMNALYVKVEVPQDSEGFIKAREPYYWLHQIYTNQSRTQPSVGLPKGSDINNAEQYGRLADEQDYFRQSILEQLDGVWGGCDEQAIWLLRSLVSELADTEDRSLPLLPEEATVSGVLSWLRTLKGSGIAVDKVQRLLKHVSSWKGDPFFADAYRVLPLVQALGSICEDVEEPDRLTEATGSTVLRDMRVEAPRVGSHVRNRRSEGQSVRGKAQETLGAVLGSEKEVGAARLRALAQKAKAVAVAMADKIPPDDVLLPAASLAEDFHECLLWLRQGDDTYGEWAQTVRLDRQREAERLIDALLQVAGGVAKRQTYLDQAGRDVPDVKGAKLQMQHAINSLRAAIANVGGQA